MEIPFPEGHHSARGFVGDGRICGEHVLQPFGLRRLSASAGHGSAAAHGQEQIAVRVDEPPAPVDLLHAEESGAADILFEETAVLRPVESLGAYGRVLLGPDGFKFVETVDLAFEFAEGPLPELVHEGFFLKIGRSFRGVGELERADFDRRIFQRSVVFDAQSLDSCERPYGAAFDVLEAYAVLRFVDRGRKVVAGAGLLAVIIKRNAEPDPGLGEHMGALFVQSVVGVDSEQESLGSGGSDF